MFQKQTILITGGTSGIGRALVEELADENVVLTCGSSPDRVERLAAAHPSVRVRRIDLADRRGVQELFDFVSSQTDRLDMLVNNAGVNRGGDLESLARDPDLVWSELGVNLAAPILLAALCLPLLLRSQQPRIVNIASVAGVLPRGSTPVYCASKAGLRMFGGALRHAVAGTDVRVIDVIPPLVDTEMARSLDLPKQSRSSFARELLRRIERSHGGELVFGANRLTLWIHRYSPRLAVRRFK
ncbi:MAG: SDR family NAD(P)-dependent oxidoreductase [bacterium]|nr:SDR family NAD(P)-dependent oxidoreductase [bacterium]